jgi:hypothetical protein
MTEIKLAPPIHRVVDYTRLAGFAVVMLLFVGFVVTEFLLAWRFVHSAREVALLFNLPVIVLALVVGIGIGSFWERRE